MNPKMVHGDRRTLSREFKPEAVMRFTERGVTVAVAGKELDVHVNVSRKWVRELREAVHETFPGKQADGAGR